VRGRRAAAGGERGSAVAEFTLVSVVLVTLFLGILQFGLVVHVRNTLVACAAEGARHAANADRTLGDGEARTVQLVAETLSPRLARGISSRYVDGGGARLVEVEVTTTLPLFGLLGIDRALTVRAHAVDEAAL
jgi:hypothetical protein